MKELKSLYNGIVNDYSIQRYTMGWQLVLENLDKRYKFIPRSNEKFSNQLLIDALKVAKGSLHKHISCFAKELDLNLDSLNEKNKRTGTQRSPFGIGS